MVVIIFQFKIEEKDINKKIVFFKPNLMKKIIKSKIIYKNRMYDVRRVYMAFSKKTKKVKLKLLLLNKISNFREIINGCTLPIDYIKNNDYIFPESDVNLLPKLTYKNDENIMDDKLRIFGQDFVKENKQKYLILCKDRIFFQYKEFFPRNLGIIKNANILEINVIALDIISNVSHMFEDCNTLKEIVINNNHFEKTKNLFDEYKKMHIFMKNKKKKDKLKYDAKLFKEENFLKQFYNLGMNYISPLIHNPSFERKKAQKNEPIMIIFRMLYFEPKSPKLIQYYFYKKVPIFEDISLLIYLSDITQWTYIFSGCSLLTSLPDISKWNTYDVNYMAGMFKDCSSLVSLPDISKWNISNVTNISYMFYKCKKLVSLPDLSKWNISSDFLYSAMESQFNGYPSLKSKVFDIYHLAIKILLI